jgi:LAO/AO transport system kinase
MSGYPQVDALAGQIRSGSVRALARGLSWLEADTPDGDALVEALYPFSGRAHVVGITGAAGAGKSTLVTALTRLFRASGQTVGVLAVDPSSPYSGGAILGDRIRMADVGSDPAVFIRSMATRGALGGLCAVARDAVDVIDAAGKEVVLIETVGVGQDEVEIMRLAHTILVVSVPGLGDDIQAMKAGLIEIADIHVVNKADKDGAHRTVAELQAVLPPTSAYGWTTPVLSVVASTGFGVSDLATQVTAHANHLRATGEWQRRERQIAEFRVVKLAQRLVARRLTQPVHSGGDLANDAFDRVADRRLSPRQCAETLLSYPSHQRDLHVRPRHSQEDLERA